MTPSLRARAPRTAWVGPFAVFAGAYFLAALLRAVTATLAPSFRAEFALGAADLGLLAGAYFLGFSLLQLPLGAALDRWGPRRAEVGLLVLAVVGCALFAAAGGFASLVLARVLIGMGVAACLMAPLTFFRRHFSPALQLRCNSWMLMTGSLGMVASTVPVQLLLPVWGWRGLFWALAVLLALAAGALASLLPRDAPATVPPPGAARASYLDILRHPQFVRMAPMGLVLYGGMIAMQALWAGPWLTQVCGWTPEAASRGLLLINTGMLLAFMGWGMVMPALTQRGVAVTALLAWGVPVSLGLLALNAALGAAAGAWHWMLWCVTTSVVALSQPLVGQAFPVHMAGRALSAYNLAVFVGVFMLQWGIGAGIDAWRSAGVGLVDAYRITLAGFGLLSLGSYLWFLGRRERRGHNPLNPTPT
jgi:predicted MFS family arabinose efflux permease